jgi:hypothetical protein
MVSRLRSTHTDETPPEHPKQQRLQPREATARQLGGVSIATVRRLEHKRKLKPIRLGGTPRSQVFHDVAEVNALIAAECEGGSDAA